MGYISLHTYLLTLVHWSSHQTNAINTRLKLLSVQLSDLVYVGHEINMLQHCLE